MESDHDIPLGPEFATWHYSQTTKTFDLSRGFTSKLSLKTTRGPDKGVIIAPELTTLVIIDMQNFFLNPKFLKCRDHPLGLKTIPPIQNTIEACRKYGIKIVWLNWALTDNDMKFVPAGLHMGYSRGILSDPVKPINIGLGNDMGNDQGRMLFKDSWNADIIEDLKDWVGAEDVQCGKTRVSGACSVEQSFWKYLVGTHERNTIRKETILFAGINSDACVFATLLDAFHAGWDCIFVEDCCATFTEARHEAVVQSIGGNYGFVIDSKSFESDV